MTEKQRVSLGEFERMFLDACYNRDICDLVGAKYDRMELADVRKVRTYLFTLYEIRDSPKEQKE